MFPLSATPYFSIRAIAFIWAISLALVGNTLIKQISEPVSCCWKKLDQCANRTLLIHGEYNQLEVDKTIEGQLATISGSANLSEIAVRSFWNYRLFIFAFFPRWTYRGNLVFPRENKLPSWHMGNHRIFPTFERKAYFYRRICVIALEKLSCLKKTEARKAFFEIRKKTFDSIFEYSDELPIGDLLKAITHVPGCF